MKDISEHPSQTGAFISLSMLSSLLFVSFLLLPSVFIVKSLKKQQSRGPTSCDPSADCTHGSPRVQRENCLNWAAQFSDYSSVQTETRKVKNAQIPAPLRGCGFQVRRCINVQHWGCDPRDRTWPAPVHGQRRFLQLPEEFSLSRWDEVMRVICIHFR